MEDELICDNCNKSSSQFFEKNTKFYLSQECQHCLYILLFVRIKYSCASCVDRYIQANPNFKCRKCNKTVSYQGLVEETKEVFEMKKIRDARKEVYYMFNAPITSYKDPNTKIMNIQKEELCIIFDILYIQLFYDLGVKTNNFNKKLLISEMSIVMILVRVKQGM